MSADVHYFGIRHHGPGSAHRLVQALEEHRPVAVLIEGPVDASSLLPMLADPAMRPPVALLCYPADDPGATSFWPFAEFSPEYQAVLWAVRHGAALRFIDLPSADRHDPSPPADATTAGDVGREAGVGRDPIGALAKAAGYEDGESWWADVIEQNPAPGPIFAAVADAMTALRDGEPDVAGVEARREAHMRQRIAEARQEFDGPIAIVCGAWHVPALMRKVAKKDDQALLKGLSRARSAVTWAPWTSPRLALAQGYGAGVVAPGWSRHLWHMRDRADGPSVWLAKIAGVLRRRGHLISTASLIEAVRLARALATIRGRPGAGFEELRDASVAVLFHGDATLWRLIESELLLGNDVGRLSPGVPLAPLVEDLQRCQRLARLKPEALERELSIDLRSEGALYRSTLLHRLTVLDVPWGKLTDVGRSRGTFRERWILRWDPEFAVRLIENLVYGSTIEKAANGRVIKACNEADTLETLASLVQSAITADLSEAVATGLAALEQRAALSNSCQQMLASVPPLAGVVRYGNARRTEAGRLRTLLERLVVETAIAMPHASRDLDDEAALEMSGGLRAADAAIELIEASDDVTSVWRRGLAEVLEHPRSTALVAGSAAHLLYEAGALHADEAATLLVRRMSPGTAVADAAGFFDGFFSGAGQRLIHDEVLRTAVERWLIGLDDETFIATLPLLRRVLSSLDRMERQRLIEAALGRAARLPATLVPAPDGGVGWRAHLTALTPILGDGAAHG
jgi:hypothetical protein